VSGPKEPTFKSSLSGLKKESQAVSYESTAGERKFVIVAYDLPLGSKEPRSLGWRKDLFLPPQPGV